MFLHSSCIVSKTRCRRTQLMPWNVLSLSCELSVKIRLFESMYLVPVAWCPISMHRVSGWAVTHSEYIIQYMQLSNLSHFHTTLFNFLTHSVSTCVSLPHTDFPSLRVNVGCGPAEERVLLTGLHAVADIYCENCKTTLGWKYVSALDLMHSSQTASRVRWW